MTDHKSDEADVPPFFSTWGRLYAAVLGSLALFVLLFYIFMKVFS